MCFSTKQNPPKQEYVFCGQILEQLESHPYLGVVLDQKMRWSPHIRSVTSKANSVLGLIKRNLWNCPSSVKEAAYATLVKPKLQYASTAWDPYYKNGQASLGQYDRTATVTNMLQHLQWDSLKTLRRNVRLTTMYKMCHGHLEGNWSNYLIPNNERRTRGSHTLKFQVPKGHKNIFRYTFFSRTIIEWNKLPQEIVLSSSLDSFKTRLKCFKN